MMPKVTMKAIAPGHGGVIYASKTGKNYHHDENGLVVVDSADVVDLLATHRVVESDASPNDEVDIPISSDAPNSLVEGATAIDPDKRELGHREVKVDDGQQNQDFGNATPPHGQPIEGTSDPALAEAKAADARAEVDQAARSGVDPEHRSEQPNAGNMSSVTASASDQDKARDPADEPAAS